MSNISIITYSPQYQPDFKRLNTEWIERYFRVEPHDLEQLDHPETHILPNNGQIFFARRGFAQRGDAQSDDIVGCVAMVNTGPLGDSETSFELAKMAVSPDTRGQGVGKQLCLAAIDYARQLGVNIVWLESNRILTPALTMYASVGFREVPSVPTPYSRADIRMEIRL